MHLPRFAVIAASAVVLWSAAPLAQAQDARSVFDQGVNLLARGNDQGALARFQEVLSLDPSHAEAYALWRSTEEEIWLQMLVKEGEMEKVARRLLGLARMGRTEKRADAAAIDDLVDTIRSAEFEARRAAILSLASVHGSHGAARLAGYLGDDNAPDMRVKAVHALIEMGGDAFWPVAQSTRSTSVLTRRDAVSVLGLSMDARGTAFLAAVAESESDPVTRQAAANALARMGGGSASSLLAAFGNGLLRRDPAHLRPFDVDGVVWKWEDDALAAVPVPAALYAIEAAKIAFDRALTLDPADQAAAAGLVRSYAAGLAETRWMDDPGALVSLGVGLRASGPALLDAALAGALADGDAGACVEILDAAADAGSPLHGIADALGHGDRRIRVAAALAAADTGVVDSRVLGTLAQVVADRSVLLVQIIDADAARLGSTLAALDTPAVYAVAENDGASGLARLHRFPGVDLVVVTDNQGSLTTDQVIDDIRSDDRMGDVPLLLLAGNTGEAEDLWGGKVSAVAASATPGTIADLLGGSLDANRSQADVLSARAASALLTLAWNDQDVSGALPALARAAADRDDLVAIPALEVLASFGHPEHMAHLGGVLLDSGRSVAVRVAAARAVGGILGREPSDSPEVLNALIGATRTGDLEVRKAAASALGAMSQVSPADRARIVRERRVDVGD